MVSASSRRLNTVLPIYYTNLNNYLNMFWLDEQLNRLWEYQLSIIIEYYVDGFMPSRVHLFISSTLSFSILASINYWDTGTPKHYTLTIHRLNSLYLIYESCFLYNNLQGLIFYWSWVGRLQQGVIILGKLWIIISVEVLRKSNFFHIDFKWLIHF